MGERKRRLAAAAAVAEQLDAARALHEAGRLAEADAAYRQVVRSDAACADAWLGIGRIARAAGARAVALQALAQAVTLAPANADARLHYAAALQDADDFDAACTHWRAACALQPGNALLWESLGIAEQASGNTPAAVDAYRRAVALDPAPGRRMKLATAVSPIPASRAAISEERARAHAVLDELLAESAPERVETDPFAARFWTNFYLAYHGENDRDLQIKSAAAYRRICPSLNYTAGHCRERAASGDRIRVGLISQFFRTHSIGRTSRGLFAQLPRERFEVIAIFIPPLVDDDVSRAIRRDAERTVAVPADLAAAREQIAALRLDVLFYQDIGMEPFSYFLSFARLARVQCVSFGHPDTTGVDTVDWFVSNDLYEPDGAPSHYSEKLFPLHGLGSLAYYYRPQLQQPAKPRAAFGLPSDRSVYLCPQNLFKVHPDMDDLIAAILRRDPRGVAVLVEGRARNWTRLLRERWRRTMPDVEPRIAFVPRLRENDYLNLIAVADVMLDTVHFNGMNTSLEAFAVGTPVVTLPASFQRGRHTQAMYRRMGLADLVARDTGDYVERAVRLAGDAAHRSEISRRILASSNTLFEDADVIREFENFFIAATREAEAARASAGSLR
jgi:predicted O-linked N-acetylglucosamine transferase (SPINDLY family)